MTAIEIRKTIPGINVNHNCNVYDIEVTQQLSITRNQKGILTSGLFTITDKWSNRLHHLSIRQINNTMYKILVDN